MNVNDLMTGATIPAIDTQKVIDNINARIDKYPKGSLSQREVVESIDLGEMSYEEAMKIADKLNSEVTKTIQNFSSKVKK